MNLNTDGEYFTSYFGHINSMNFNEEYLIRWHFTPTRGSVFINNVEFNSAEYRSVDGYENSKAYVSDPWRSS